MSATSTPVRTSLGAWYALAVNAGQEASIRERILDRLERHKLPSKNLTLVAPEEEFIVTNPDNTRKTQKRMSLPGYLLVHCSSSVIRPEVLVEMGHVKGVLGFLGGDERPTPLRASEVERILGQESKGDGPASAASASPFSVGDEVRVVAGPLAGFTAEVIEINESRGEAKIEVEIFGRTTPTTLPFRQLAPA